MPNLTNCTNAPKDSYHPAYYLWEDYILCHGFNEDHPVAKSIYNTIKRQSGIESQVFDDFMSYIVDLSPELAYGLSKATGESVDFWMNIQNRYNFSEKMWKTKDTRVSTQQLAYQ